MTGTDEIAVALAEAEELYRERNPKSLAQHRLAGTVMPGGDTRTAIHVDPFPLTMCRGDGAKLWDLDSHEYRDFLSEFTTGIFGHSHPAIRDAVKAALANGINLGAQSVAEARFAAAICARFPSIDLVRFTNSGTEANFLAISAARAITGRSKVLVFSGGYHGSVLVFRRGSDRINAPFDFIVSPYNNIEAVDILVTPHRSDLAAILIEPMLGSGGCIPAEPAFLAHLRTLASATGAVLIFDEVVTSRLAPGGVQELVGILPDLTTLGKYVGGGMTFGALGGRADLMERFDPRRGDAFFHESTFSNNALTMTAGLVGLVDIYTPERARSLNAWGDGLRDRLNAVVRRRGLPMQFTGMGSIFSVHMTDTPIRSIEDAGKGHVGLRDLFYFDLVACGIWLAKRGMMTLSIMLTDVDADHLIDAVEEFATARMPLFREERSC